MSFKILRENNYVPPFHDFLLLKFPIQNCFWADLFLIVNRFPNFLQHILGKTKHHADSAKEMICIQLNEMKDIPEKTLSESRNCTLALVGSEQYIRPDVSICIVRKSLSQYGG